MIGHDWMDPYKRINISAKLNSRNEEKRRQELTRTTKATTTKAPTTTTTINPLCMPQIVKIEAPSQTFYPPFTSKDWSPGLGR